MSLTYSQKTLRYLSQSKRTVSSPLVPWMPRYHVVLVHVQDHGLIEMEEPSMRNTLHLVGRDELIHFGVCATFPPA
jgi:hypothetical protein